VVEVTRNHITINVILKKTIRALVANHKLLNVSSL
jgi:hypothetical protein